MNKTKDENSTESPSPISTDKIYWKWDNLTEQIGYPRLQGNVPMFETLTLERQNELNKDYNNVNLDKKN